jgi:hypothetical protein
VREPGNGRCSLYISGAVTSAGKVWETVSFNPRDMEGATSGTSVESTSGISMQVLVSGRFFTGRSRGRG